MGTVTGGSVATDALFLLIMFGFKRIILTGLDLAFTNGAGHTKSFAIQKSQEVIERTSVFEVEGYDGGRIATDFGMKHYLDWFENMAKEYDGKVELIDATEGGARINGTVMMPLCEAINKYCCDNVDFDSLISGCENTVSDEEVLSCFERLGAVPDELLCYKNRLMGYEDKLRILSGILKSGNNKGYAADTLLSDLNEVALLKENEKYYEMVNSFNTSESRSYVTVISDVNIPEEEVAKAGAELMKCYINNIDEILSLIKRFWDSELLADLSV
jgi:hypothetical protein